jgi:hypothetical protein
VRERIFVARQCDHNECGRCKGCGACGHQSAHYPACKIHDEEEIAWVESNNEVVEDYDDLVADLTLTDEERTLLNAQIAKDQLRVIATNARRVYRDYPDFNWLLDCASAAEASIESIERDS